MWHRESVVSSVNGHTARSTGVRFEDPALEASVLANLELVERRLHECVESADPFVTEAAKHLLEAGGKRFRPMLVAVCAHFGDPTAPELVDAAAVLELTHVATLYHDDVMDEALMRRGTPSANARWGNSLAILVGDFLFSRAAELAAGLGPDAVRIQAQTFAQLVHGQIAETVGPRDADPIEHHLKVLAGKTGSLMATCATFGGMFSGAPEATTKALTTYAEVLGLAFQLSDDLLDISSDSSDSGKTPGTDLREGVPTLPVLYALASQDSDPAAVRLRQILADGPVTDDALHAEALELLRDSVALKRARQTVRGYADQARAQLQGLPQIPARDALESLCDVLADRIA
ncbi:polyprenyl synthetase family protein [Catellatospora bangladeshensis]|uniref:Geranylgeranyl pyrophosphate synthase n=1 Tax=Catellatospora bangladeshensis TaxID=310355 RepID=A0A8J3JP58_9ACTN|nr:geranylgeranyl pyrophosphate synthase [Catellatospora bangladeshensis]